MLGGKKRSTEFSQSGISFRWPYGIPHLFIPIFTSLLTKLDYYPNLCKFLYFRVTAIALSPLVSALSSWNRLPSL